MRCPFPGMDPYVDRSAIWSNVTLDLQAVFERSWETGPYPELLQHDSTPPGGLKDEEIAWCRQRLVEASSDSDN